MSAVTHLAGNRISIGQYSVQRCLLCGAVLDEYNARNLASPGGNTLTEFLVGGFYQFEGNHMMLVSQTESPHFASDLEIPENCCVRSRL